MAIQDTIDEQTILLRAASDARNAAQADVTKYEERIAQLREVLKFEADFVKTKLVTRIASITADA